MSKRLGHERAILQVALDAAMHDAAAQQGHAVRACRVTDLVATNVAHNVGWCESYVGVLVETLPSPYLVIEDHVDYPEDGESNACY